MKIFAWNVNGIRSVAKKGFVDWFKAAKPDILCLQETRATLEQLPDDVREIFGSNLVWANAEKKGYSGVATWSKPPPTATRSAWARMSSTGKAGS